MLTVAVAVASGVGAVLRYVVDRLVQARVGPELPLGTFVVNTTGAFMLGLVTGLSLHRGLPHTTAVVLGAGLAGGYTTLSTLAWESLSLAEVGDRLGLVANLVGGAAAGMLAAGGGLALALV